ARAGAVAKCGIHPAAGATPASIALDVGSVCVGGALRWRLAVERRDRDHRWGRRVDRRHRRAACHRRVATTESSIRSREPWPDHRGDRRRAPRSVGASYASTWAARLSVGGDALEGTPARVDPGAPRLESWPHFARGDCTSWSRPSTWAARRTPL